ncbi:MAG: hypothetical protein JO292_02875, partial [Betaproteobacteria bacterium]|nr:hypothetical protein [Betaproteobacteria bacterium]
MKLALALYLLLAVTPVFAQSYAGREEVQSFIDDLVKRHGFKPAELKRLFSKVQRVDPTAAAIPTRIDSGLARALPQDQGLPFMMRQDM